MDPAKKCDFFLWEDEVDPKLREAPAAEVAAAPVKVAAQPQQSKINRFFTTNGNKGNGGDHADDDSEDEGEWVFGRKRKRLGDDEQPARSVTSTIRDGLDSFIMQSNNQAEQDDDDDDDEEDDDGHDERTVSANSQRKIEPATPTKQRQTAGLGAGGLPSPVTRASRTKTAESNWKRLKLANGVPATPTTTRVNGEGQPAVQLEPSSSEDEDHEFTKEIMHLLAQQDISSESRRILRHTINSYMLRMRGVKMSRDMNRDLVKKKDDEIKSKDQRIAELEIEVRRLKNEANAHREMIERTKRETHEHLLEYPNEHGDHS